MALKTRRKRRTPNKKLRLHKPRWIDPFPMIPGTEPEKRVFALLFNMNIYFVFQGQVPEFETGHPMFMLAPVNYKPDFVLPEYRLIIDPFSPYHHSLPDAAKRDKNKVAAYAAAGYAYYHPWAIGPGMWTWNQYTVQVNTKYNRTLRSKYSGVDNPYKGINRNLRGTMNTLAMLSSIPELARGPMYPLRDPRDIAAKKSPGYRLGPYIGAGATSVAAGNKARTKPKAIGIRSGSRRSVHVARPR